MSGTLEGGRKAAATNKAKYGKEFYSNIGRKGGSNYTKDQLERIREELGWNDDQSTAALSEIDKRVRRYAFKKRKGEEMTGEALRKWRISIGASQAEIAKRAGVSRQTIVAYEQKSELPMTKILEAYGLVIQPMVCSISENLENFTDRLKEDIEEKTGRKCQIKINIELCGEEE